MKSFLLGFITIVVLGFNAALASGATISSAAWTVTFVDSQQTTPNYLAINAFDSNPATIWHTEYTPTVPPLPHEIQINLGASYMMTGFWYLPRQDSSPNGRIGQYEFYVSTDGVAWGTAVATGTLANDANEKLVTFPSTTGQYIRLKALTEANGGPWTSMAELKIEGISAIAAIPSAPSNLQYLPNGTAYALTVAGSPTSGGSVRGAGYYLAGTTATAVPVPTLDFAFAGWTGACSGTGACTPAMTSNKSVTALFAPSTAPSMAFGWNDASSGTSQETSIEFQRRTPCGSGSFTTIQTLPADTISAKDSTVQINVPYDFLVRYINSAGAANSSVVCATYVVTGDSTPPSAPGQPQIGAPTLSSTTALFPTTFTASVDPPGTAVTRYDWVAGFNDGSFVTSGSIATNSMSLFLPFHFDNLAAPAFYCVNAVDTVINRSSNSCNGLTVPAHP